MADGPKQTTPCSQHVINTTRGITNTMSGLNATQDGVLGPTGNCTSPVPTFRALSVRRGPMCDDCDLHCVLTAASLVFFIGVIANCLVILVVITDKRLHSSTFVAITGLALADLLFLSTNLVMSVEELLVVFQCVDIVTDSEYFKGVLSILWKNATFSVAFLAVVRYILLVHPLKARQHLTNTRIVVSNVVILIIAVAYNGIHISVTYMATDKANTLRTQRVVNWCASYFIPLCFTSVLHVLKVLAVRRSIHTRMNATRSNSANSGTFNDQTRGMTRVIALVLTAELILPLPRFILFLLMEWTSIQYPNKETELAVKGSAYLLYLLKFSINPFIYACKSPQFQKGLNKLFCKWKRRPAASEVVR